VPPLPPRFVHFPPQANMNFDDVPNGFQSKIMTKINELSALETSNALSEPELKAVESSVATLANTSYYHSTSVSLYELQCVIKLTYWTAASAFPGFDLLRLISLHPQAARALATHSTVGAVFDRAVDVLNSGTGGPAAPTNSILCTVRFLSNTMRFDELKLSLLANISLTRLVGALRVNVKSPNKTVRVAVATLAMNLSLALHSRRGRSTSGLPPNIEGEYAVLIDLLIDLMVTDTESVDVLYRATVAVGTIAVLGGAPTASKLASSGFQRMPMQALQNKWADKLTSEAKQCIDEALRAVETFAQR
jgi:hypothetical protein